MTVTVDGATGVIGKDGWSASCLIGRSGTCPAAAKREGDGCTPRGTWRVRGALLRPDRMIQQPRYLPWRWIRPEDGWSDDPSDSDYNRPVRHPHRFSAERLWRPDRCYDAIIVLGYNDDPPVRGCGSAIFLHLVGSGSTEGCVAVEPATMTRLLESVMPGEPLTIG